MPTRPISSFLLCLQVVAVWALTLAASLFSQWNERNDQLATIILFGAAAMAVPVYQLIVRVHEERRNAKVAPASCGTFEPQYAGASAVDPAADAATPEAAADRPAL